VGALYHSQVSTPPFCGSKANLASAFFVSKKRKEKKKQTPNQLSTSDDVFHVSRSSSQTSDYFFSSSEQTNYKLLRLFGIYFTKISKSVFR
jgi:hypothetical protein